MVKKFTVLSKSLRPLPLPKTDADGNMYDEFTDPELRYRQRYVDLIVNSDVKNTFLKRSFSSLDSIKIVRSDTVSINFPGLIRDGKKSTLDVLKNDLLLSWLIGEIYDPKIT